MRHAIRYLPAFLALLVPLAILAFLGGRELSAEHDRAESLLRDRAYDFLTVAVTKFDEEIRNYTDVVTAVTSPSEQNSLLEASMAARQRHTDLLGLIVLRDDGRLVYPQRGPRSTDSPPFAPVSRELPVAQALMHAGDQIGAIEHLEEYLADADGDQVPSWHTSRSKTRARVQLAGLYRAAGRKEDALKLFSDTASELGRLEESPIARLQRTGISRWERRARATEFPTSALLARTAASELLLELSGDSDGMTSLLEDIGAGRIQNVHVMTMTAALDRIASRAPTGAEGLVLDARAGVAELADSRAQARIYDELVFRDLSTILRRSSEPDAEVWHVFDDGEYSTNMIALRRMQEDDVVASAARSWVGFQVDLTALTNRVLAAQLAPTEDGFHLDVLTQVGSRVLRHELPEGADDWQNEAALRSGATNLQFRAIPRNARQQLESQHASARTRTLLMIALVVIGVGGAFYLVRTVGRETELANMKVDLVSRVSHDLKTPLAMIKMYGDTVRLGRTRSENETRQFADIISREADRLTLWIDRILDFSGRQGREVTYQKETIDLGELITRICDEYQRHVEAQGLSLSADLEDGLLVSANVSAIEGSMLNLLENATKYTNPSDDASAIEVTARRIDDRAIIEVLDRGVGIPEDEQEKVFEGFYRATTAGEARGTGLGLSLVRHYVHAHDGSVEITSRQGGGSVIRLSLPLLSTQPSE